MDAANRSSRSASVDRVPRGLGLTREAAAADPRARGRAPASHAGAHRAAVALLRRPARAGRAAAVAPRRRSRWRQQLALLVDRLLALVQRDLERCPTGSGVVPILSPGGCAGLRRRGPASRDPRHGELRHRAAARRAGVDRCEGARAPPKARRCDARVQRASRGRVRSRPLLPCRTLAGRGRLASRRARWWWLASSGRATLVRQFRAACVRDRLRSGAQIVRFGQRLLEVGELGCAASRLRLAVSSDGVGCARSSCISSRSSASHPSRCSSWRRCSSLTSGSGCTGGLHRPRRPRRGALDHRVALEQLAAHRVQAGLVVLGLGVDVFGFCAPEVDLFLGELLGTGFGDLELLLELRDLDALGFDDLLEMAGLPLPPLAFGFDAFEPMGQNVELLLELDFSARVLRFNCSSNSSARASDSLSALCKRAMACSANSRELAIVDQQ